MIYVLGKRNKYSFGDQVARNFRVPLGEPVVIKSVCMCVADVGRNKLVIILLLCHPFFHVWGPNESDELLQHEPAASLLLMICMYIEFCSPPGGSLPGLTSCTLEF